MRDNMISINTGLRYSSITHPLVERTYSLSDHSIPPRKYSDFLRECVDAFISLVLKLNKSSTLNEAKDRRLDRLKKFNPNVDVKELEKYVRQPIEIYIDSHLIFKDWIKSRNKRKVKTMECVEKLLIPIKSKGSVYGIPITFEDYGNELNNYVSQFRKALNERYPKRKNKIPGGLFSLFRSLEKSKDNRLPTNFEFNLHLYSQQTRCLEVDVTLVNHGSISIPAKYEEYFVPGIKIKAESLTGPLNNSRKVVSDLEEVVENYYGPFREITHSTHYSQLI
ncbi:hypothetical protein J4221_01365 [Candidatus Pacearchaeota archaeon]|nr:hypothetical protein [Candidatus Pacearchaeota archaeon]